MELALTAFLLSLLPVALQESTPLSHLAAP